MRITCDWHTHSRHSPCGKAGTTLEAIRREAAEAGVTSVGISDHLHCRLNVPALRACRAEYDALADRSGLHFGLEVSCLRRYDLEVNDARGAEGSVYAVQEGGPEGELTLYLPPELLEELKVEYVIGGTHWPLGAAQQREAVIRSYHRQNVFLASHPLVDVVAHPWWWQGAWEQGGRYPDMPWFDDFGVVPRSMHEEFAAAAVEHGTAVEVNAHACLLNGKYPPRFRGQYREYLAMLKERGVRLSLGSDSHGPGYSKRILEIADDLAGLGLTEADLWRPGLS